MSEKTEIENAVIRAAYLGGWENSVPGTLVVSLDFAGDGWGQGSGHFSGMIEAFVIGVLHAVQISEWSKLPGTHCRIRRENGRLVAVGHYLEDKWFEFASPYGRKP